MSTKSVDPARRNRRWIFLGFILIALPVAAYFGIVGGLKTCRWLDRLLGISGCIASHQVTGLRPLSLGHSLVVPVGGDIVAFFGRDQTSQNKPAVLVVLDATSGTEKLRTVVAKTEWDLGAIGSADGQQTALICYGSTPCFEDGSSAITISTRDGKKLGSFRKPRDSTHEFYFPTDPAPPKWTPGDSLVLPGGDLVVVHTSSKGKIEIRKVADESLVRTLRTSAGEFKALSISRFALSPSGRQVAVLALMPEGIRMLAVFDVASGLQVASLTSKDNWETTVAWAGTEDRLVVVRLPDAPTDKYNESTDVRLDIYAIPKAP